ncbi:MAG: hypothetical protein DWC10_04585 [Candidatus Poseidoniales archaeon]|nr:MAG: hypothetical protein DWC10_04585 [Candidatus Poseidoniales archaeon]
MEKAGEMMQRRTRNLSLILVLSLMLVAPVLGNPNGPPWDAGGGNLVIDTGCTCHGGGAPSTEVVVSVSGVPRAYNVSETYTFTISLQHASNSGGGFLFWDEGIGTLAAGEGSQSVDDEPGALSQSEPGNDWVVEWTAPSEDMGPANFKLVGNAVNGDGLPNEDDKWNILTFTISAPGATEIATTEDVSLRTISVGDYDSLFVAEEDPEALEAERQEGIAHEFFANGNLYYWTTLSLIIVAAVIQGEFYERRFGGGPPHLDKSLAVPQGLRRGVLAAGLAVLFAYLVDDGQPWGYALVAGMLTLWAIYGVYRTIVQARAPKQYLDLV